MNKTEILVVDFNESSLLQALDAVSSNVSWNSIGVSSDENVIEKFHQFHFDVLLLANSIGEQEARKLQKLFLHQQAYGLIVTYEPTQLHEVVERVTLALNKQKAAHKYSFSVTDDAFKPKVNIQ